MLDITLSAHFGSVASTWADDLMEEFGEREEAFIRELVDKQILPDMVGAVCRACEDRSIRNPDVMESYAKHAVTQFDKRLNQLLVQRNRVTIN